MALSIDSFTCAIGGMAAIIESNGGSLTSAGLLEDDVTHDSSIQLFVVAPTGESVVILFESLSVELSAITVDELNVREWYVLSRYRAEVQGDQPYGLIVLLLRSDVNPFG